MQRLFAGRFLPENERPLHACTMHCTHRDDYGYVTVAVIGKGCQLPAERDPMASAQRLAAGVPCHAGIYYAGS